jgi:hypothetical protein
MRECALSKRSLGTREGKTTTVNVKPRLLVDDFELLERLHARAPVYASTHGQ